MRQWVSPRSIDKNLYVGAWIPLLNGNTSNEKLLQPLNYLLIFRDPVNLFPLHDKRLVCPISCGSARVVVGAENSIVWWRGRPGRRCRNTPPHPSSCSLVCDTLSTLLWVISWLWVSPVTAAHCKKKPLCPNLPGTGTNLWAFTYHLEDDLMRISCSFYKAATIVSH